MANTYLQSMVWKRSAQGETVVYVCFQRLRDEKFAVQNVEFFHAGKPATQWQRLYAGTGELFLETDPGERCAWFDTIDEAVAAHDRDFGGT